MIDQPNDGSRHRRIDPTANPFLLLGVSPAADRSEIEMASARARQQQLVAEDALKAAVEELSEPTKRLPHELAYPIDSAPGQMQLICTALTNNAPDADLLQLADNCGPLSRLHLVVCLVMRHPTESLLLSALLSAQAAVGAPELYAVLKDLRSQAGLPPPSLVSVSQSLRELKTAHYERLMTAYSDPCDAAQPLLDCCRSIAAARDPHRMEALSRLVGSYERATAKRRVALALKVQVSAEALSRQTSTPSLVEQFEEHLQSFVSSRAPMVFLATQEGQANSDFEAIADTVCRLLVVLNESRNYAAGARLAKRCRDIFAPAPTIAEQFAEPAGLLESLAIETALKPLSESIERLETGASLEFDELQRAILPDGPTPPESDLWLAFDRACEAADLLQQGEHPWRVMRDFAWRLSERPQMARLAIALVATLIQVATAKSADRATLDMLERTRQDIEGRIAAGQRARRRVVLAASLSAAAALACVIFFWFKPGLPGEQPKTNQAQAADARDGEPDTKPPIGKDQHFSREFVRYCEFQKERLLIIKQHLQWPEDVAAYNTLANDYNSRCSNYLYRDEDMKAVTDELSANKAKLEAETQRVLASWPWRTAGAAQTPAAK